jgi:hypothetical protein
MTNRAISTATVPAQVVVVSDTLDANLDGSTLEMVSVGSNGMGTSIAPGLSQFEATTQVASNPNPVQIRAKLDPQTSILA